jgi:ATP phosphoribosyltransferase regulatory subunit
MREAAPRPRLGTAPGFRDLLPDEAEALRAGQEAILAEMRRWGYRHVVTPAVESLDVLGQGLEAPQLRRLFKFADARGEMLALVGERTVPVARLVAGKMRGEPLPLRLCYAATVHAADARRFEGRREGHQTGAELLGAAGPVADAEVIALAVRCLDAAGLRRFQVDVGHSEFFQGLLEGLRAGPEAKLEIREALAARDFVTLQRILDATPLRAAEHELLLRFPALRGGPEILEAAAALVGNRRSERALEELARVRELLDAHGIGASVSLDLGAIRDFDYYTGVTFEGFGADLGRPLAAGGRYDRLLERFGRPAPATGFVVHLDLVGEAIARSETAPAPPGLAAAVAWSPATGLQIAIRLAGSLRMFGLPTVIDTESRPLPAARAWAAAVGSKHLVHCSGRGRVTWAAAGREPERLTPDELVARLAAEIRGAPGPPRG